MKKSVTAATIFIFAVMICLVAFPDRYVGAASEGIVLWATSVLPALFPFFFLTVLLTKLGVADGFSRSCDKLTAKLFRCGGESAYVFLMSVLSGYPVGARLVAELRAQGAIGKDEATRMATLASTSGPLFVAGTVGTVMFGNKYLGYIMFASHITSAIICGIIFGRFGDFDVRQNLKRKRPDADNILYECVYSSVISILCVGGFICIFYLVSNIFADFGLFSLPEKILKSIFSAFDGGADAAKGFFPGLIECTNGCRILGKTPSPLTSSLACSLISFGGISIIFQSLIYLKKADCNIRIFLMSKTLQMVFSFFICLALVTLFNIF